MRPFNCSQCGAQVYFENSHCMNCHADLGFAIDSLDIVALPSRPDLMYCQNYQLHACNWLVNTDSHSPYCLSCQLNNTIPDLSQDQYRNYWFEIERAKRRLLYSLFKLNLPVVPKQTRDGEGIWFDFLAPDENEPVLTGHLHGLITLNIHEADSVAREASKKQLGEPYRTLLGHFRHEIGHYFWQLLVEPNHEMLNVFRGAFGDERIDYQSALSAHYERKDAHRWDDAYVSFYASSHPWEDWAETWAHYLHILDALDTASQFGMAVERPDHQKVDFELFDPYQATSIEVLIQHWLPMTYALNSINRSMGLHDFYPFVLTPKVIHKLGVVHDIIRCS